MEIITLAAIARKLQAVITAEISREDAANWALQQREALEAKKIIPEHAGAETPIWDALFFVEGIDLQDAPGSYLHNADDVINYLKKLIRLSR